MRGGGRRIKSFWMSGLGNERRIVPREIISIFFDSLSQITFFGKEKKPKLGLHIFWGGLGKYENTDDCINIPSTGVSI